MLASPIFDGQTILLDRQVLVLNRLWQAVNVTTVRRAFTLLFQGEAEVVTTSENEQARAGVDFFTHDFESWRSFSEQEPTVEMIRTVAFRMRVPQTIVLSIFDRLPRQEIRFTRHNLFERDRNTCQYCARIFDRKELNLDHVLPRDRGGRTTWENIVCSCIPCNTRKANRLPHEAGMRLVREPQRPRWRPFSQQPFSGHKPAEWRHFLDLAYWNVELGEE